MRITAEPRSDQWNADDFVSGPKTFTIAGVNPGKAEQKYDIELVEGEGRSWRPPLTMLRVLLACWGDDAKAWVGRRVTLFRDPDIKFGRETVGGIRVSHASDIAEAVTVKVQVSRGRRAEYVVQPLIEQAPTPPAPTVTPEMVAASVSVAELQAWWQTADPSLRELIEARAAEVKAVAE